MQPKTPRVSVLIPVYNTEKYLGQAIRSILDQTYTDFELILCDDCSTDGSVDVARSFDDPRITVLVNETNLGSPATRNRLNDAARGEFCALFDSDDYCMPDRLEKQVAFMDANPDIDLLAGGMEMMDQQGYLTGKTSSDWDLTHEQIKITLLFYNPLSQPTIMFRREKYIAEGIRYDEQMRYLDDMGMYVKAIDKLRFRNLPDIFMRYRRWEGQTTLSKSRQQFDSAVDMIVYRHRVAGFDPTDADLVIIREMHTGNVSFTKENVRQLWSYMVRLMEANSVTRVYDQRLLCRKLVDTYRHFTDSKVKKSSLGLYLSYKRWKKRMKKLAAR